MKKKGFTLIELLAVIIILAVIALIATPIVLNVVDNAKESARQSSVAGYADATKLAIYDKMFENGKVPAVDKDWAKDNVKKQGSEITCDQIYYSDSYGVVLEQCNVDKDTTKYCFASGKTYTDCSNSDYQTILDTVKGGSSVSIKVSDVVYFNPISNKTCTDYVESNSNTEVKTGCMKWYIYKIEGDNISLLLDHNTTATSSANDYTFTAIERIKMQLETDTSDWTVGGIGLISVDEITNVIKNANPECSINNFEKCSCGWIYDRTFSTCTDHGCSNNATGPNTYGYWTSTISGDSHYLYGVQFTGGVSLLNFFDNPLKPGIRPVITINKSIIK